jgi:DNA polymerase (family 10)
VGAGGPVDRHLLDARRGDAEHFTRGCRERGHDDVVLVLAERRFVGYEDVGQILSRGPTRSSVVLRNGTQVDLRVVSGASYGAALQYFTGSKAHNIALRQIAAARGLKLNEYGLFDGTRRVAGRTEDETPRRAGR